MAVNGNGVCGMNSLMYCNNVTSGAAHSSGPRNTLGNAGVGSPGVLMKFFRS